MRRTERVQGKVAVVTGGRGDLGSECVRLLVENGARVASIDVAGIPSAVNHDDAYEYDADVTNEGSVSATIERIVDEVGIPSILVNAAGVIGKSGPSHQNTTDDFNLIFDVNVKGVWLMTKHIIPFMIAEKRGSIINFSSIHGITGGKHLPLYHATKGAVRLLTKSDAATYGEFGIRVNSIHPGSINTLMSQQSARNSAVGTEEY